jgi:hypothetical protein
MSGVPEDDEVDRTRVRAGLAIVSVTFLIALVALLVIESAVAKIVMGLVMFTALVRAFLLARSLRR